MRGPPGYSWGDKRRGNDALFLPQREGSGVGWGQDFVASEKPQQHPVVEENLSGAVGTGQ